MVRLTLIAGSFLSPERLTSVIHGLALAVADLAVGQNVFTDRRWHDTMTLSSGPTLGIEDFAPIHGVGHSCAWSGR